MSYFDSNDPLTQIYRSLGLVSEISSTLKEAKKDRGNSALFKMSLILNDPQGKLKYPSTYSNETIDSDIKSLKGCYLSC